MKFRELARNSLAQALRVAVAAVTALALPAALVRLLPPESYAVWALILQLSAYVTLLDFGVQTAVGRFVAHANELDDRRYRDQVVSAAVVFLAGSALLGGLLVVGLAWLTPLLFREIPPELIGDARLALLLVGLSLAAGLPASAFSGVFIGLQRSEVPVAILVAGRLLTTLFLPLAAWSGVGLPAMGLSVAVVNLLMALAQWLSGRRLVPDLALSTALLDRGVMRELAMYCLSLSVWTFGMLLVSGLDLVIVGYFAFDAVPYYAVAVALTNFIIQMQGAIFGVLVPAGAALGARAGPERLGDMLVTATRYGAILLVLMALPLIFYAEPLLTVWVGAAYAEQTSLILQVLVAANLVRLLALPYANLLVATNQQSLVVISPLVEGAVNLVVSIAATLAWGALGAAVGTLVGGLVSVGFHLVYNLPRTRRIVVARDRLLVEGMLRPLACAVPVVLLAAPAAQLLSPLAYQALLAAALALTAALLWRFGLLPEERRRVVLTLAKRTL